MMTQITNKMEATENDVEGVVDRVAVFGNVYERIREGLEWVQQSMVCSIEKEPTMKERCVMVNEWNRGVFQKRLKIEAQTKGTPLLTYEPKLHHPPATTVAPLLSHQPSSSGPVVDRNNGETMNRIQPSPSRGHRLGRIRKGPFGTPTKKAWSPHLLSSERRLLSTKALIDDGLSPIAEGNEDFSSKGGGKLHQRIPEDDVLSRIGLYDAAE